MPEIEPLAVLTGAIVSLVGGFAYYTVFESQLAAARGAGDGDAEEQPPPWKLVAEFARGLVLAAVVAAVAAQGGIDDLAGGVALGLALWAGFPAVLWSGAMLWERTSLELAAVHAGDWLLKLVAISALVAVWQ